MIHKKNPKEKFKGKYVRNISQKKIPKKNSQKIFSWKNQKNICKRIHKKQIEQNLNFLKLPFNDTS